MNRVLYAGVAKKEINASVKDASEIRDLMYVRTLVLNDGNTVIALLALDAVGIGWICDIPNDFLQDLRVMLQTRCGIAPEHVIVSATHTHPAASPQHCPADELLERCARSVENALQNQTPVRVASGKGEERRFTVNRTMTLQDKSHWTIRHSNPCPPDRQIAELGDLDNTIGIIRLDRADSGKTLAVLFNFACHPLWADAPNRLSGNYPGVACRTIEDCLPGATAVFLQGAGGDVCDKSYKNFEQDRDFYIEIMGSMLGLSTVRKLHTLAYDSHDSLLDIASATVRLPRKHDFDEQFRKLDEQTAALLARLRGCPLNLRSFMDVYFKYKMHPEFPLEYPYVYLADEKYRSGKLREMDQVNHANISRFMENVEIMEELARLVDRRETFKFHCNLNGDLPDVGADVNAIRIGDAVLVTSPTEMLTQVGMNIKAASPFENTFIAAYCNGYLHYGAPAEYYPLEGYEVTECMLDPRWQQIHEKAAAEVLQKLVENQK